VAEAPLGWVVDTNVLSNRGDVEADPNLVEWLWRNARLVRISVVTVAEMRRGLFLLEARIAATTDRTVRAREQARLDWKRIWYDELTGRFADRLEPIDIVVAEKWAETSVRFPSRRNRDKAIAATALAKGYGVAAENLGDFRRSGVKLVNPFDPGTWDEGPEPDLVDLLIRS
jgi:predicted nucleic acid-binding protein